MPLSKPSVSVVIPTHNRLSSLSAAIESVLIQTYPCLELIVVDDGSTDGTSAWVSRHFPQVELLSQANFGVSHARNRGIEKASGQWIALLDSDDRWYENKLEVQVNAIESNPDYRLCHCDEHWIRRGKRVNPKHKHQKYGGDVFQHCLPLCAISPSAVLLRQDLLMQVGMFDESLPACEDYDLWLRICSQEPVLYVDQALLEKTGGHADQLSQRFPAMDQFRLQALAKLLRSGTLSEQHAQLALQTFREKFTIYSNGARKRNRRNELRLLNHTYAELIDPHFFGQD